MEQPPWGSSQSFGNSKQFWWGFSFDEVWCRFYADFARFRSFGASVSSFLGEFKKQNSCFGGSHKQSTCKSLSVHLHFFNRTRCSWNWSYNLNKEMFMIYRKDITFRYNQYDPIHHHGKWISHHQYTSIWISSPNTALLLAIKSRIMITRPKKVGLCSG